MSFSLPSLPTSSTVRGAKAEVGMDRKNFQNNYERTSNPEKSTRT